MCGSILELARKQTFINEVGSSQFDDPSPNLNQLDPILTNQSNGSEDNERDISNYGEKTCNCTSNSKATELSNMSKIMQKNFEAKVLQQSYTIKSLNERLRKERGDPKFSNCSRLNEFVKREGFSMSMCGTQLGNQLGKLFSPSVKNSAET